MSVLFAAIVAAIAIAWTARRPEPVPGAPPTPVAVATTTAQGSTHPALANVEATVAANNAQGSQQAQAFVNDGWTFVDAAPPDPALLSASPTLLPAREAELRVQLASAPPSKQFLSNVVTVAVDAREPSTRVAAVEAIARMGKGDPQHALVSVMRKLPASDEARRALVSLMRPTDTADPFLITMAALLDDPAVTGDERKQLAMTLAVVALRDGGALPGDVAETMSPAARALVDDATRIARTALTGK